jgi:hypothetical protein
MQATKAAAAAAAARHAKKNKCYVSAIIKSRRPVPTAPLSSPVRDPPSESEQTTGGLGLTLETGELGAGFAHLLGLALLVGLHADGTSGASTDNLQTEASKVRGIDSTDGESGKRRFKGDLDGERTRGGLGTKRTRLSVATVFARSRTMAPLLGALARFMCSTWEGSTMGCCKSEESCQCRFQAVTVFCGCRLAREKTGKLGVMGIGASPPAQESESRGQQPSGPWPLREQTRRKGQHRWRPSTS